MLRARTVTTLPECPKCRHRVEIEVDFNVHEYKVYQTTWALRIEFEGQCPRCHEIIYFQL